MDETPHAGEQMPGTIGRYQVQDSIGYGAMGAVYKAFDPLIKRTLAIKTIRLDIPKQSPQYKSFIERFYHEARISGTLSHPNIVTLFDIGEEGGLPYLAMEYVEGETIASLLERGLRFKPEKVIGLVSQIASAIDYAHTKGVIHRDIKPSNLILYDNDRVKVTDFGIAKLVDAEMTQSGTLLGTPSYMSPEQAMGDKLDGRSDIFSLGVCAFEMLCGDQPFPGNNVTSILYKLVHVDPIEPANLEMNGLVPEKWHEVFGRVLAKKPDDRYQTATEFVQDLEYCLGAWFGAMGDETAKLAAMPSAEPERPAEEVTAALPAVTGVPPSARKTNPPGMGPTSATTRLPPSGPPAARKTGPMIAPPRRADTANPGRAGTMSRPPAARAAEAEPEDAATVMLKGPAGPPSRRPSAPALPAAEAEAATILMRGSAPPATSGARPSRAPAPLESEEATIVMKGASPHPSAAPTVRQQAPSLDRTPTPTPGAPPPFPGPPLTAPAPAPVMAASRRSMLTLALAGIGVLLLLVVLAAAGIILLKRPAPVTPSPSPVVTTASPARRAPPPTTLPPVTSGTVHVESTPAGATVAVDGEKIGKTPLDTPALALGAHQVTLELDGYTSTSDSVTLTAESPATQVKQTLSRTAPATGVADVTSTPAGATVKIDGTSVGTTPLRGRKLNVGRHRVEVSADGYDPFAGSLTVREGQTARLDAALHPVPAPSPIHTPPARAALPDDHVYDENDAQIQPKPIKVSGKSAEYPKDAPALKRGQRSSVTVSFVVLDSGEVSDVQVVESAGSNVDEAVISAYKTWKFTPGMRQGSKVRVRVTRRQTFLGG